MTDEQISLFVFEIEGTIGTSPHSRDALAEIIKKSTLAEEEAIKKKFLDQYKKVQGQINPALSIGKSYLAYLYKIYYDIFGEELNVEKVC